METFLMQAQSVLITLLMFVGVYFHKNRKLHVKIMSSAMIWDVLLILQVELSRSAIIKASKAMTNTTALNIHVSIAVTTVVLYVFMVLTGRRVLNGEGQLLRRHRFLGFTTLGMRVLTLITSFWAVTLKV